jgi:cyanuric acid amidohydrolase
MNIEVHKIPMNGPDDLKGLKELTENKIINFSQIIAIIVKTEGNGNVNDFTRGFTTYVMQNMLSESLRCSRSIISDRVSIICSGGCEGVMSPHATIFSRNDDPKIGDDHDYYKGTEKYFGKKRLSVGVRRTRNLLPEEIGTTIHVNEVSVGVKEAMSDAGINNAEDVHFVQIKCPLLTSYRINDAESRGKNLVTKDTLKSMAFSRGASSLGVATALHEIDERKVTNSAICNDWSLYSNVASASAGIELMNNEIIVMGNSEKASSHYLIGHSVMSDPIDSFAVLTALRNVGINSDGRISKEDNKRIVNVFAKAGAHPSGIVRGRRTTMLTDSDINSTRHARAVVNAVIASIVNDPMIYVSGGSEHQGPLGGGPVAVIASV